VQRFVELTVSVWVDADDVIDKLCQHEYVLP
jgi:hypothetical protein